MDAVSRFPYIPYDDSAFCADYVLFLPWIKAIPASKAASMSCSNHPA
ncbi:hypothetical protein [Mesorhizobium sp. WSM3626]|nr:hypothetical protein [Mesorhizobium sp. WSM3626]